VAGSLRMKSCLVITVLAQGIDLSPFVPRSLIFIKIPLFGTMYLAKFFYTEGVFVVIS
jgi:hypothetical protein